MSQRKPFSSGLFATPLATRFIRKNKLSIPSNTYIKKPKAEKVFKKLMTILGILQ